LTCGDAPSLFTLFSPSADRTEATVADRLWRMADIGMLVAFAFSVVVQLPDPDPWAWMAIYGLAAVACALVLKRRGHWIVPALVAGWALIWAAAIAPRVIGVVPFGDMFGAFEMADTGIEESREMYGLLLVAAWMVVLALRRRPESAQRA
jgi:hypothetical protein